MPVLTPVCSDPTPHCDPPNDRCVECRGVLDCAGNTINDQCDSTLGQCVECDGLNGCAADEHCVNNVCKECISAAECDDGIACTQDVCHNNTCASTDSCPAADGQFCNGIEVCDMTTGLCEADDPPLQRAPPTPFCHESQCVACIASQNTGCPPDGDDCTEDICMLNNTCVYDLDSDGDGIWYCNDICPGTKLEDGPFLYTEEWSGLYRGCRCLQIPDAIEDMDGVATCDDVCVNDPGPPPTGCP